MKIYWVSSRIDCKDHFFTEFDNAKDFLVIDTIDFYEKTKGMVLHYAYMKNPTDDVGNYEAFFLDTFSKPFVVSYIHSARTED